MNYYGNNDWRDYQSLKHWKYIKREKVNGKWKYYYDNDKLGIKNFIDTKITGKAYKQHQIEAGNKIAENSTRIASVENHASNIVNKAYKSSPEEGYRTKNGPEVAELTEQAGRLKKESEELRKEANTAAANYSHNSLKGAAERELKNIKETVKDKLGYDERESLEKAEKDYLKKENRKNQDEINFSDSAHNTDLSKRENRETYEERRKSYAESLDKYRKAGEEYAKAKTKYLNTPLGKLDNAKTNVVSWLKKKFKIH